MLSCVATQHYISSGSERLICTTGVALQACRSTPASTGFSRRGRPSNIQSRSGGKGTASSKTRLFFAASHPLMI
ncbi:hypothetical protein ILYODFUR_036458 [Ilyodon furcidens]|uniref:Uncharacterized protein n=3 Tax=Goodeidae TaxID=28758 RepID=A0ABU7BEQ5_9TELE|nr:hypothetical protein [Ataeniobius toweri]MED6280763.1 hypothetical protein [Characodon lateralis]